MSKLELLFQPVLEKGPEAKSALAFCEEFATTEEARMAADVETEMLKRSYADGFVNLYLLASANSDIAAANPALKPTNPISRIAVLNLSSASSELINFLQKAVADFASKPFSSKG